MDEIVTSVEAFLRESEMRAVEFFNEAELQHELGYWLRTKLPENMLVYFERPAASFFPNAHGLVKKEIDLVIAPANRSWHLAIELKCPRNGRVPETMFDACRDLQLLEQLVSVGFRGGLFVMHVDDAAFYQSGLRIGIYSFFRGGAPLTGTITKPTGSKDQVVRLGNSYSVRWQPYGTAGRFWLQAIASTPNRALQLTGAAFNTIATSRDSRVLAGPSLQSLVRTFRTSAPTLPDAQVDEMIPPRPTPCKLRCTRKSRMRCPWSFLFQEMR